MAQRTLAIPSYVSTLAAAIRKRIPKAKIDYEQVHRDRYRFIVVSSRFTRMGHPERQSLVWDLTESALKKSDLLKVAMIITMSPKELPQD